MKKLMFGIAGEMLAGKSTAAQFLKEHFRIKQVTMSTVLNDVLAILDLPFSRENQQNLAKMLREQFGDEVLARLVGEIAAQENEALVMIDGIRKPAELEELKKRHNFKLIFIKAPLELRYQRAQFRGEKSGEQKQTLAEFKASHSAESEVDINRLEAQADLTIANSGTEQELFDQLTKLVTETL